VVDAEEDDTCHIFARNEHCESSEHYDPRAIENAMGVLPIGDGGDAELSSEW
jgi:hypothetical protein